MIKCSCIAEEEFNFTLDYRGDNLIFTDYSKWVTAKGNIPQEYYDLVIINKESGLEYKANVKLGLSTLIPLSSLRSSQMCKQDGIYTFRVESCGMILEKTEAIIPSVNCAYTQLLLRSDKTDQDWDNIYKVWMQIEMVKASSKEELLEQASEHFRVLSIILKQLNCNC